jgi:hypothetical protein
MITNANPEPTPPNEPDQDETDPTPPSVLPHHAQPLVPRAAWLMEDDDRSDEQADADWRRACDSLLGTQLAPHNVSASSCTEPAPSAPRRSFFDEEYVAGRRVPSPSSEETAPSRPIGFVPIPYPHIPNESIDDEADRHGRWIEDSERRMKRARGEAVVPPTVIARDLPPTTGSANTMATPVNATANPRRDPPENIARMRDRIRRALLLPSMPASPQPNPLGRVKSERQRCNAQPDVGRARRG